MIDMSKYKFYKTGNKIIAVSTYAGRTVRGVAKCDPRDSFDETKGQALAAARCNAKIAAKRCDRADMKYIEARKASRKAEEFEERMYDYMIDSDEALTAAEEEIENIMETM